MEIGFNAFINELAKYKLVIIGEIHGTKEIPKQIKFIIDALIPLGLSQVLFEIPKSQQHYIEYYISSRRIADLKAIPIFNSKIRDGRNSREYLFLLRHIISRGLKVSFVDSDGNVQDREIDISRNVIEETKDKKGISLFITGNFHARLKPIQVDGVVMKPAGYFIKQKLPHDIISVNMVPASEDFITRV